MQKPTSTVWLTLAALLMAVAVWGGWKLKPGDAPAQPVAVGSAEPFAWVDCKPRLLDGAPAVAVMFTQPLARSQDWGKLVKVTEGESASNASPVPGRWVLGDNPRMLYLPYVTPDRTYRIALDQALAAAGGGTLGQAKDCTVKSEAMPESFYFASRGVVLPAGQNGGLPVVTVNTPEVDVQFLRVDAASLPTFLERVGGRPDQPADSSQANASEGEEGDYQDGYIDPGRRLKGTVSGYVLDELRALASSVYLGRFATDARPNRRNVSYLPVEKIKELQEPGIYVAVMNPPGRFGFDYR